MRVLIFDTETTGLPKSRSINPDSLHLWPHIVQLSYIIYDISDNDICVIEDNIIKIADGVDISQESSAIHGITNEISKSGGVDLNQVLSGFFGALKNVDILVTTQDDIDSMTHIKITKAVKLKIRIINKEDFEKNYIK